MTSEKKKVEVTEEVLCPWAEKCSRVEQMEDDLEKFYNELVNMNLNVNILNHYLDSFTVTLKEIVSDIQSNIEASFDTLFPEYDISEIPVRLRAENLEDAEFEEIEEEEDEKEIADYDLAETKPDIAKIKADVRNEYLAMIWDVFLEEFNKTRTILV